MVSISAGRLSFLKQGRARRLAATAVLASCAGFGGGPALAQEIAEASADSGFGDIVVTARKRAEAIQDVPVAISAVGGDQLVRLDVQSVMDLSAVVPNFQAPRNTVSFSAPQFFMRGAGRANNNWNAENAVAVFVDDIYLQSTAGAYIDMLDYERVEALRGPQGTLYGRNATTGAIKFIPRRPSLTDTRIYAEATYGRRERLDLRGGIGGPLVEGVLAAKLDVFRSATDGFLTRVTEANAEVDDEFARQEHYGARLSLLWQASDTLEFELNVDGSKQDNGTNLTTPIAPADPTDLTQLLSKRGTVKFSPVFGINRAATEPLTGDGGATFEGFGVVFKASLETDFGTLKSITGYREYDDTFLSQLSGRGVPSTIFGVTLYSTVDSVNAYDQFTQEIQFSGEFGDRFKYVVGAYYFDNNWYQEQYGATIGVPAEFSPVIRPGQTQSFGGTWNETDQNAKSYALYIDGSWEFIDGVSLLFGGRQTWDKKRVFYDARFEDNVLNYPGFPVTSSKKYKKFTPKIGLNWRVNDDVLLYGVYSVGYKAGNLEGDRASDPGPASNFLEPEVVKTWEAGLKADWFDGLLRTNITGFLSKYSNKADLISPQTVAIADVEINGLEFELALNPARGLRLWVNGGLMEAKYTSADPTHPIFAPDPTGFVLGFDAQPVMTPGYSLTAGVDYLHQFGNGSELALSASVQAVDDHFNGLGVNNYDSEIVEAYEVVDASASYRLPGGNVTLTAGVNNLFDANYYTTGFFGSVPEYAGRYYSDGRTWYLRARFEY
jgi:iron complex outermembrane receptor protein